MSADVPEILQWLEEWGAAVEAATQLDCALGEGYYRGTPQESNDEQASIDAVFARIRRDVYA